jgi:peptide/nickel transport system permease protein
MATAADIPLQTQVRPSAPGRTATRLFFAVQAMLLAAALVRGLSTWQDLVDGGGARRAAAWIGLIGWVALATDAGLRARRLMATGPSRTEGAMARFALNRPALHASYVLGLLFWLALLAPLLGAADPSALGNAALAAPFPGHPLGTDNLGRDVLARLAEGSVFTLVVATLAVVCSATVGTTVGMVAGFLGGRADKTLMFLVDFMLALPRLILAMAALYVAGGSQAQRLVLVVLLLGLTGWMDTARLVRAQVLTLREQDFLLACKAIGVPLPRTLLVHVLPNVLATVAVNAALAAGAAMLTESALSFLGLGLEPPRATLGTMANDGYRFLSTHPAQALLPGLVIATAVVAFNLVGDGLRDALDPRRTVT